MTARIFLELPTGGIPPAHVAPEGVIVSEVGQVSAAFSALLRVAPGQTASAVSPGVAGLLLETVEDPADVSAAFARVPLVIAQIATPDGLARVGEIAAASRGKSVLLAFDATGFARTLGLAPGAPALTAAAAALMLAARAGGLSVLGLPGDEAADTDFATFADLAIAARAAGFVGAITRFPDAVDVLAHAFAPQPEWRAVLARVLEDYRRLHLQGQMDIRVDGQPQRLGLVARVKTLLALRPPLQ